MDGSRQTAASNEDFAGTVIVGEVTGYSTMRPSDIAGFAAMHSACLALFEHSREEAAHSGKKSYLRPVLRQQDFAARPEIVRYALDEEILEGAARYLGVNPVLRSLQLFWTAANESTAGSQMFHFDHVGERQLKLFVYMHEVDDARGPFSFLPADVSERVRAQVQAKGDRYKDENVFSVCSPSDLVVLKGGPGAGGLVDTTRCLHFGGRAREGERLMTIIQYVRPEDDFEASGVMRPVYPDMTELSSRQRTALRM